MPVPNQLRELLRAPTRLPFEYTGNATVLFALNRLFFCTREPDERRAVDVDLVVSISISGGPP